MCVDEDGKKRIEKWILRAAFDIAESEPAPKKPKTGTSWGGAFVTERPRLNWMRHYWLSIWSTIASHCQPPGVSPYVSNVAPDRHVCLCHRGWHRTLGMNGSSPEADHSGPYLPSAVLWRQKEQFSDGVGYGWIDGLRDHAEQKVPPF